MKTLNVNEFDVLCHFWKQMVTQIDLLEVSFKSSDVHSAEDYVERPTREHNKKLNPSRHCATKKQFPMVWPQDARCDNVCSDPVVWSNKGFLAFPD